MKVDPMAKSNGDGGHERRTAMSNAEHKLLGELEHVVAKASAELGMSLVQISGVLELLAGLVAGQAAGVLMQNRARQAAHGVRIARPGEVPPIQP
jgi:hypothetical protein